MIPKFIKNNNGNHIKSYENLEYHETRKSQYVEHEI